MHTNKEPLALAGTVAELRALGGAEPGRPVSEGGEGAPQPHPTRSRLLRRLSESPWLPLVGRGAAIVGGLMLFAGIGIYSTQAHPGGVHVASQVTPGAPVSWLAPTPALTPAPESSGKRTPPAELARAHGAQVASLGPAEPCSGPGALCDQGKKDEPPPGVTKDGKVILNVAGPEALTRLPGVGERRAEAIVKLRERLKRFRRATDLLRIRGIGVRSLKRMLPHLVLDPPPNEQQHDDSNEKQPGAERTPG